MLKHSIVSSISIVVLTAVFMAFQIFMPLNQLEADKAFQVSILVNLTMATFLGVYLGGALLSLKQNYLWTINQYYRSAIMSAYLIIIGIFSLLQMPFLYINLNETALTLFAPFCITIFSSQMVLGKTALYKIIIPATPFIILQLHRIEVGSETIILFIMTATAILVNSMYRDKLYPDALTRKNTEQLTARTNESMYTGSSTISINHFIGVLASKWVASSKKNIAWAVLMPHTKLAVISLFYLLLLAFAVLITGEKNIIILQKFGLMFLSFYIIEIVMESSAHIRQVRFFSHVYIGDKHRELKNKILLATDKSYITNSLIFFGGILLIAMFLEMEIDTVQLVYSAIAVMFIACAVYPLLLCLSWVNITFSLVFSVCIYAAMLFGTLLWIDINTEQVLSSPYSYLFILGCVSLRVLSQNVFWRYPLEKLLKNK